MKPKIVIIGKSGHCKSVIDVIEDGDLFSIEGIIDKEWHQGETFMGYPVIGSDEDIPKLVAQGYSFHVAIGHIKNNNSRKRIFEILQQNYAHLPSIISKRAYVSPHASIGDGSIVFHNAIVNACALIGINSIINTGAVIEHDSIIGNHCHVATGAYINGGVTISDDTFVGSKSVIVQGLQIGAGNLIAAGSVVIENTLRDVFIAGNPAKQKSRK